MFAVAQSFACAGVIPASSVTVGSFFMEKESSERALMSEISFDISIEISKFFIASKAKFLCCNVAELSNNISQVDLSVIRFNLMPWIGHTAVTRLWMVNGILFNQNLPDRDIPV